MQVPCICAQTSHVPNKCLLVLGPTVIRQHENDAQSPSTTDSPAIAGLCSQVQAKSHQLLDVLRSCSTPQQQALAYLTLASRIVSQCGGQVQKIGSFAFPLAYVCVAVGAAVPAFMELLLAKLQQVGALDTCVLGSFCSCH